MTKRPQTFRALVLGAAAALLAPDALAQRSAGGTPPSFTEGVEESVPTFTVPAIDAALRAATESANAKGAGPYQWGLEIPVDLAFFDEAVFDELGDGRRVWRLRVASPGAHALSFMFSEFELAAGTRLFVHDGAGDLVLGAYTAENNKENRQFQIEPLPGEAAVLELVEPAGAARSHVVISHVVHDHTGTFALKGAKGDPKVGACHVDVNCPEGQPWKAQSRAVTMLIIGGGLCTGALINNTANDGTQYFMSANHCGSLNNAIFRFGYERSGCSSGSAPTNKTVQGSTQLATSSSVDFRLVRITESIPASYQPYFLGWSRGAAAPPSTITIHHPDGAPKKISFDNNAPSKSGTDWRIAQWDLGVTEPGSSGCPLMDHNGRFIGQLCCGQATCSFPFNDYYGRFELAWSQVAAYLDPLGTGATAIDGFDPAGNCGSATTYGDGCPGTWLFTPELTMNGCFKAGGNAQLDLKLGLGGANAFLMFGLNPAALPLQNGCTLNVTPLLPIVLGPLPLTPGIPSQGAFSMGLVLPPSVTPGTIRMQAFVADPGVPQGYSNTKGLALTIQ